MKLNYPFIYTAKAIHRFVFTCVLALLIVFCLQQNIGHAQATLGDSSVSLLAIIGNKVSVSINGGQPKVIGVGQVHQGIKLLGIRNQEATFQLSSDNATRQITLRIGQAPYKINTDTPSDSAKGQSSSQAATSISQQQRRHGEIVLQRAKDDHFYTEATINGKNIHFLVDTGASFVTLSARVAQQLGIDYTKGTSSTSSTANGLITTYRITLHSINIQNVTLYNIEASVIPGLMMEGLLGQSFLRNFKISIKDNQMILQPR